jgi:hypothetical protein
MATGTRYESHPFADLLPMMSRVEFDDLKKHIQANGQQEPITIYQGKILDGRNRYAACLALGVEPAVEEREFADDQAALDYVIARNLQRRNLSAGQKAVVALTAYPKIKSVVREERIRKIREAAQSGKIKANLPSSGAGKGNRGRPKVITTVATVGDLFGVSATYVRYAEAIQKHDERLLQAVLDGKQRLYNVYRQTCHDCIKQKRGRKPNPVRTGLNRLIRLVCAKDMPDVLAHLQAAQEALAARENAQVADASGAEANG